MGKTLASVLEAAALVGVQFIPGVGQVVGGFLGVSARLGTAIATLAVVGAEAGINAALAPGAAKPEQTEMALKPRSRWPDTEADDDGDDLVMTSPVLPRQRQVRHDDLYDADELGAAFT